MNIPIVYENLQDLIDSDLNETNPIEFIRQYLLYKDFIDCVVYPKHGKEHLIHIIKKYVNKNELIGLNFSGIIGILSDPENTYFDDIYKINTNNYLQKIEELHLIKYDNTEIFKVEIKNKIVLQQLNLYTKLLTPHRINLLDLKIIQIIE